MGQKAQGLAQGRLAPRDQRLVACAAHAGLQRLTQGLAGDRVVQGLLENLLHMALVHGRHGHVLVGIGRHQQSRHVRIEPPHLAEQSHAVARRHRVVGEQHRHLVAALAQQGQRLFHAGGGQHGEFASVQAGKPFAGLRLVVHHQDGVWSLGDSQGTGVLHVHEGLGKSKVNSVQAPSSLSTARVPPWRCTMP
ncbi:hypothetical protein D9M68_725030 [compost metagenome]